MALEELPGSYTAHVMFANSPNENVSQQYSPFFFKHILSRSVILLQILPPKKMWMPQRTDAHALSYLAIRLIEGVMPKKEKHNVQAFIVEMKHIMVPLVNVLNTGSKLYVSESRFLSSLY